MASKSPKKSPKKSPEKDHGPPYERKFGHCIITWKIKNFSLAACNSGTEIRTIEFTVSVSRLIVTRWQIGLRVESECSKLQLFLKRLDGETDGPLQVFWKIKILNWKGEGTFVTEKVFTISKNFVFRVYAVSPLEILRALPAEESDEVTIEFQIIVLMKGRLEIPTPTEEGLRSLIDDLTVVGREGLHSDVIIVLNDQIMKAHKAVLCPRSKRLSERCQSKQIPLYLSDTEAINRLFAYLYTGELKYIFDPPSISIYDYIKHLNIEELLDSYPEEKITVETVIEATKFEFRWTIKDFSTCDGPQDSEIYEEDGMKVKWQLRIYPKGLPDGTEMHKKYVYIEALALDCQRSQDVYVDFITRNDEGLITVAKRTHGKVETGEKLEVGFMRIGGSSMEKSVVGNVLNISFSVHAATGKINSTITETHPPKIFKLTNFDTYQLLSDYMGHVQFKNIFSDVTLVVEDQEFEAHKFMLAGRSIPFSRMVHGLKDDSPPLQLNNMRKHVFRIFKEYLYTGVLKDTEVGVLFHLYDAAIHYMVRPLENCCLRKITEQLSPDNSCYLLMFAHERRLATMKNETLRYISAYREHIIDNMSWRKLEEKNPPLFYDLVVFLADSPPPHPLHGLNGQQRG